MSKKIKLVILSVAASVLLCFLAMLLLAVPIGAKGAILPILAFYITGVVAAAFFLIVGAISVFYRFRGLTGKGAKYYDNTNTLENKGQ